MALCGLEHRQQTARFFIGSPEEYVHGHALSIMLTQVNSIKVLHSFLYARDEDEDEDMESRGSGFVVLNDVSQACTSCWEWSFGGDHA